MRLQVAHAVPGEVDQVFGHLVLVETGYFAVVHPPLPGEGDQPDQHL